jgi:hypothetical protein
VPTLVDAYNNCLGVLKPQKQGTCGLYSFWFATMLLNDIYPGSGKKPVVYPRKCEGDAGTLSLRKFSKDNLGSGQGELLTYGEVARMVKDYLWDQDGNVTGGDQRKIFISTCLTQNRPVMFSYLAGGWPVMPQTAIPISRACGPHWSLIIAEDSDTYEFIEPNDPLVKKKSLKNDVLRSNEIVDTFAMETTWHKPNTRDPGHGGPLVWPASRGTSPSDIKTTYTVNVGRQALNNLLVAIY